MSKKIRFTIAVDEDMHETLRSIAQLSGKSTASVVREYLDIGRDALKLIEATLEHAAQMEEAQKETMRARLDAAAERIMKSGDEAARIQRELTADMAGMAAARSAPAGDDTAAGGEGRKGRKGGFDPRIVTRGFRLQDQGGQTPSETPSKGGRRS